MILTFELAGFFAAHAIWCVSEGETLVPMLAWESSGQRKMDRLLIKNNLEVSVEYGKRRLKENSDGAESAVLLFDGRISTSNGKLDVVCVMIRDYSFPDQETVLAIPYKAVSDTPFRVYKPKVFAWQDCPAYSLDEAIGAFFKGVSSHEKGARIWYESLDKSI